MSSTKIQAKNLDSSPDGILKFGKERIEIVNLGELTVARVTLQPGWSWKKHVKARVNIKSCKVAHSSYNLRKDEDCDG